MLIRAAFISLLLFSINSYAVGTKYSLRKCILLPVTDSVQGAIGIKVFKQIENYIRESKWCYYRSNSELLNVLSQYNRNLEVHLQNPDVIRLLAEKSESGSLIKIVLKSKPEGLNATLQVLGENGIDVFFKEKAILNNDDPVLVSNSIINWLKIYEKIIPYDGRVIGVLGETFTVDIGKASDVKVGQEVIIRRPILKKKHPLLKEVVEWDTELLAKGQIFNISEFQASTKITKYYSRKKINSKDWVRIEKDNKADIRDIESKYPQVKGFEFGKLGTVGFNFQFGQTTVSTVNGSTNYQVGGLSYGVNLDVESWLTRNWIGGLAFGRYTGTLENEEGFAVNVDRDYTMTLWKIFGGFRYLPMGFFYGPQIDLLGGYGKYSWTLDKNEVAGLGDGSVSGFMLGFKGSAPIHKLLRAVLKFDFLIFPTYKDDSNVFGSKEDEVLSYHIEVGGQYNYSPQITADAMFQVTSNKVTLKNGSEVELKDTSIKLGGTFTF